jgi:hypothetical protein
MYDCSQLFTANAQLFFNSTFSGQAKISVKFFSPIGEVKSDIVKIPL